MGFTLPKTQNKWACSKASAAFHFGSSACGEIQKSTVVGIDILRASSTHLAIGTTAAGASESEGLSKVLLVLLFPRVLTDKNAKAVSASTSMYSVQSVMYMVLMAHAVHDCWYMHTIYMIRIKYMPARYAHSHTGRNSAILDGRKRLQENWLEHQTIFFHKRKPYWCHKKLQLIQ